jgi:hypothetical protein
MTVQEFDDRDVEFTGVLAQRLEPGETPEWKLSALYEALGVKTDREAVLALARLSVEGFKQKSRRRRPGRASILSRVLDASEWGLRDDQIPAFLQADFEERLFRRMEAILAAAKKRGQRMKAFDAASLVIKEREIDGSRNFFFVGASVARGERESIVDSVWDLFKRRRLRRKLHEAIRRPFLERAKQEVSGRLEPHWTEIREELRQRLIQEVSERQTAGERVEDILADNPERMKVILRDITDRYF